MGCTPLRKALYIISHTDLPGRSLRIRGMISCGFPPLSRGSNCRRDDLSNWDSPQKFGAPVIDDGCKSLVALVVADLEAVSEAVELRGFWSRSIISSAGGATQGLVSDGSLVSKTSLSSVILSLLLVSKK